MELSGKLTFNAVAIKELFVDKKVKSSIISLDGDKDLSKGRLDDFTDHPMQGEVVGIGNNVTVCKKGDIVLFKIYEGGRPPLLLNDMGTLFFIYNEGDILLVREKNEYTQ